MWRKLFRFRIKHVLFLFALVSVGFWAVPEIYREILWRPERDRIRSWAIKVDRRDRTNHIHVTVVKDRVYSISTKPQLTLNEINPGSGTLKTWWSLKAPSELAWETSPYGEHEGYYITPQCVWVESPDEAVNRWKRTSPKDWSRYYELYSLAHPAWVD